MSFLSRHRTICAVLQEIQETAQVLFNTEGGAECQHIIKLCDEAIDYARRMSARLTEYKARDFEDKVLLIDANAMLQYYMYHRPDDCDGSTKGQTITLIAQISKYLSRYHAKKE